jgi:MFS family permease
MSPSLAEPNGDDPAGPRSSPSGGLDARDEQIQREEPFNMAVLALHAIGGRIGWIFKTESVIIPAFLDSIAGAGWMRGLLPVLNRFGQSTPTFLLSRRLKVARHKKVALALSSLGMAVPYLLLAWVVWATAGSPSAWLPWIFLVLYTIFFGLAGLNMVSAGTLQGKLVRPERRGRLMTMSIFGGVVPSVLLVWWLLPGWLEGPDAGYQKIFLFTGVCFVLVGALALALREPLDAHQEAATSIREQLRGAREILRSNGDYRRLVIVGGLFSSSLMIFPHFQALGRERLDLAGANLMVWVVVQNVSMGVASLFMGPVADRFGNRLTLRILTFAAATVPLLAIGLTYVDPATGRRLFPLVFMGIGLTPIGFRVLTNYILEVSPEADHPRYLSLSQLCTAAAFLAAPLFGLAIDLVSYDAVFVLEALLLFGGGMLTFRLNDPRSRRRTR